MKSMFAQRSKWSTQRSTKFIAPGELAKEFGHGQKGSKTIGESNENVGISKNILGTKRVRIEEQEMQNANSGRLVGEVSTHTLILHFGEDECKDNDFTEDSCFLDIMSMCRKFIDINSYGFKVTDGDGKELKNDKDLLNMLKEHEYVENIDIYLDLDETRKPLAYKLPQNMSSIGKSPIPSVPKARDVVNCNSGEIRCISTNKNIQDVAPQSLRNTRGKNKNKKVARLKPLEKLEVQFYNNRAVGKNHSYWSRHLGKIVRDNNICPIRVNAWKDIPESSRQHMWDSVKECFSNPNIELFREHTLDHMGALWTAWRSSLNAMYVKKCKTKAEVLKNVPKWMNPKDWEWLVINKFLTDEFQKISNQNSNNRVNGVMPHRTGSKPHRQLIFEKGGKENNPLDVANLFFETRQKNGTLEAQAQKKYDEIVEIVKCNPSLSHIELVERSFGPQRHSHIFGYGGGMKRKDFKDSQTAYIKELEAKLCEKDEENSKLKKRMDMFESRLAWIEDNQSNSDSILAPCNDIEQEQVG